MGGAIWQEVGGAMYRQVLACLCVGWQEVGGARV